MLLTFCFFIYITSLRIQSVYNWSAIGHHTTAAIAQQYLTKHTLTRIDKILKDYKGIDNRKFQSIIEIATYPDEIRKIITWSFSFHFCDMAENETRYNEVIDCGEPAYCIVKALQNYTKILQDYSITDASRLGEALAFVVHFMGDIHQPLHIGNKKDHGGNDIPLVFSNEWNVDNHTSNLHQLWDNLMVLHFMNTELKTTDLKDVFEAFIHLIEANPIFKQEYLIRKPDFIRIAEDSRFFSFNYIYQTISDYNRSDVSIKYYNEFWPIAKMQIMKSGLQMARLLNDIFDHK